MAMYVPLGLGMMVKGPVGVLGPIAALGLFVLFFGSAKTVGGVANSVPSVSENKMRALRLDTLDGCLVQFLRLGWRRLRGGRRFSRRDVGHAAVQFGRDRVSGSRCLGIR